MFDNSRVSLHVDLDAVVHNLRAIGERLPEHTKILAVVKANGYGCGALPVARRLEKEARLWGYGVATAGEALRLRQGGIKKPVLVLGHVFPEAYEALIREEVRLSLFRADMLPAIRESAHKKKALIHIPVDTGMSRIGVFPDDSGLEFVREAAKSGQVTLEGLFTHFATADESDHTMRDRQFADFMRFAGRVRRECRMEIPLLHAANSAAAMTFPASSLDMVRVGIAMYGMQPSRDIEGMSEIRLLPALSMISHISFLKTVPAGTTVSYGATFVTKRETRIATVPVGYADGYPRSLSGKGYVLIRGQRAPVIGRICMDQFMADVTDIPGVEQDAPVTLIGTDGEETITAELLGELSGRFNYELVCDISERVPRIYRGEAQETAEYLPTRLLKM